jgi:hypothetical protein
MSCLSRSGPNSRRSFVRPRASSTRVSQNRNPLVSVLAVANICPALVSAQVSEMQLVREKVYAMEQTHMTLKQK